MEKKIKIDMIESPVELGEEVYFYEVEDIYPESYLKGFITAINATIGCDKEDNLLAVPVSVDIMIQCDSDSFDGETIQGIPLESLSTSEEEAKRMTRFYPVMCSEQEWKDVFDFIKTVDTKKSSKLLPHFKMPPGITPEDYYIGAREDLIDLFSFCKSNKGLKGCDIKEIEGLIEIPSSVESMGESIQKVLKAFGMIE